MGKARVGKSLQAANRQDWPQGEPSAMPKGCRDTLHLGPDNRRARNLERSGKGTAMRDNKMTAQDLIYNLEAAGLEAETIERYLSCWKAGKTREQLQLLSAQRASLLEHVHTVEKQIDCLDYLVYQIGKGRVTA